MTLEALWEHLVSNSQQYLYYVSVKNAAMADKYNHEEREAALRLVGALCAEYALKASEVQSAAIEVGKSE